LLQSDRFGYVAYHTFISRESSICLHSIGNFQAHLLLLAGTNQLAGSMLLVKLPQGSPDHRQPASPRAYRLSIDGQTTMTPPRLIVHQPLLDSVTETKIAAQNYDANSAGRGGIVLLRQSVP